MEQFFNQDTSEAAISKLEVPELLPTTQIFDCWDKVSKKMLNKLYKHKHAWLFKEPVDPEALGIPDYFKVVKNPMDFSTIKAKLAGNKYLRVEEFLEDLNLTFDNCFLYNGENT